MAGFEWEIELDADSDVADASQSPLHEQPDPSTMDVDAEALEKLLDAAIAAGIPIDLSAFQRTAAGFKLAHLWFSKKKRAKLNAKIARLRRQEEEKAHDEGGRSARAGTWSPQHPASELDVPRTFSNYGAFIPSVTTQRARHVPDPRGRPRSRKFGHMNFLIDVSGSMARGVSPSHAIDVFVKEGPDKPWKIEKPGWLHTRGARWDRSTPLVGDPRGPKKGYPRFEVRVSRGLPNEGSVVDPTDIRRVQDVAVEVSFAMLQEARKRKNSVSVISFDSIGRLEVSRSRDYARIEKLLLLLEPWGSTRYDAALEHAVKETQASGGRAMTVLVTDAERSDLQALMPREATSPMRVLVNAGPFFLVCLGVDPEKDAALKRMLSTMREEYGSNFEVGVFPDVTSEDAVFQAARWSVRL